MLLFGFICFEARLLKYCSSVIGEISTSARINSRTEFSVSACIAPPLAVGLRTSAFTHGEFILCVVCLMTLSITQTDWMIVIDDLERIWKDSAYVVI